jgi:8-oxo-dGTP pyrophosphatase MutT (NUDIX family)
MSIGVFVPLRERLIPLDRPLDIGDTVGTEWRRAAVLILLFPHLTEVSFLLTERPTSMRQHAGQISLPGGAEEPGDPSLWHTATREAHEELGLRTGRVRPLGRLEVVNVSASRYMIVPFVAWNPILPRIRAEPGEVSRVIEVRLSQLLDPALVATERWKLRGQYWHVTFYRFGDHVVWGATAGILSRLAVHIDPNYVVPTYPGSVTPA